MSVDNLTISTTAQAERDGQKGVLSFKFYKNPPSKVSTDLEPDAARDQRFITLTLSNLQILLSGSPSHVHSDFFTTGSYTPLLLKPYIIVPPFSWMKGKPIFTTKSITLIRAGRFTTQPTQSQLKFMPQLQHEIDSTVLRIDYFPGAVACD